MAALPAERKGKKKYVERGKRARLDGMGEDAGETSALKSSCLHHRSTTFSSCSSRLAIGLCGKALKQK